jgi:NADH:ubiquinone oxidoreductase subunit 4 (subunit M)
LSWREIGLIAPLVFLMVFMGVYPSPFLNRSKESVVAIEQRLNEGHATGEAEHAETTTKPAVVSTQGH